MEEKFRIETAIVVADEHHIIMGTEEKILCAVPWRKRIDAIDITMDFIDKLFLRDNKSLKHMFVAIKKNVKKKSHNIKGEEYDKIEFNSPFEEEGELEFPCPEKFAHNITFAHFDKELGPVCFDKVRKFLIKSQ